MKKIPGVSLLSQASVSHYIVQLVCGTLGKLHQTLSFPCVNTIPLPKFSGDASEDIEELLRQLDQADIFCKLTNSQKAEVLPFLLTGNANVWFSASLH